MEEMDRHILWEQLHSPHLMRFQRTGACVLQYEAEEDNEAFDVSANECESQFNSKYNFPQETSLRLKEGEYALSKDITCLWVEYRRFNGNTPLRDASGGDLVIINEDLHGEYS